MKSNIIDQRTTIENSVARMQDLINTAEIVLGSLETEARDCVDEAAEIVLGSLETEARAGLQGGEAQVVLYSLKRHIASLWYLIEEIKDATKNIDSAVDCMYKEEANEKEHS